MRKRELIEELAGEARLSKRDASRIVSILLNCMVKHLKNEEDILLSGFGTFEFREHRARNAYNPQTKEVVSLPPKKLIKFKPGTSFLEKKTHGADS